MDKQFVMLPGRRGSVLHTVDEVDDTLTTCGLRRPGLQRTFNLIPDHICQNCILTDELRAVEVVAS